MFLEFELPVLDTVDLQMAVRHERFTDFGLDATTPKIAGRWEVTPEFAVRASWGESFLAPTPEQARPFIPNENCFETFSGTDPFTGQPMTGSTNCASGNPSLKGTQVVGIETVIDLGIDQIYPDRTDVLRLPEDSIQLEIIESPHRVTRLLGTSLVPGFCLLASR